MKRHVLSAVLGSLLLTSGMVAAQNAVRASLPYAAVHDPQFISAADATFMNNEDRVIGLMSGKKAYVFAARGGIYGGDANWQTVFVRQFLGFLGINDVEFVYAEGLAISPESRNKSLAAARFESRRLALQTRRAA